MKKTILTLTVAAFLAPTVSSACTINVSLKKAGAKTVYFSNGLSMSLKSLNKTGCSIKASIMSESRVKALKIADLKKKLEKLQN